MKGLLVSDFEAQIQLLLGNDYKIVALGDFVELYKNGLNDSEKFAVLTFDDGLKGHATNAVPVLQKYGVCGTFFAITRPLKETWMVSTHQLHFVLASSPIDEIKSTLDAWLATNERGAVGINREVSTQEATKFYPWDDPKTASIKYLLNVQLKEPVRSEAIGYLFSSLVGGLGEKSSQFYLSAEDLRKMRSLGMEIGSHSHSHLWLSSLSREQQEKEVSLSKSVLEDILGEKISLFSYPYGTSDTFSESTIKLLKDCHYLAAVTTDEGYAATSPHPFSMNRIDTNEVKKYIA